MQSKEHRCGAAPREEPPRDEAPVRRRHTDVEDKGAGNDGGEQNDWGKAGRMAWCDWAVCRFLSTAVQLRHRCKREVNANARAAH